MVRTGQLVGKAIVIIEFNAHADSTAEVSRMKQLSKYNRADVHWFNEDTEESSLNTCHTKTQRRAVISLLAVSGALGLEKSEGEKLDSRRDEARLLIPGEYPSRRGINQRFWSHLACS